MDSAARKVLKQGPIDVSTDDGFDEAVQTLAARWSSVTSGVDERVIAQVLRDLDVDWSSISPERRASIIEQAVSKISIPAAVISQLQESFSEASREVAVSAKAALAELGVDVSLEIGPVDDRIADVLSRDSANYVTDEYGRRSQSVSALARAVVARGVEDGLSRRAIADDLSEALGEFYALRSSYYWEVASSAFAVRARSYTQIATYREAGIEAYQILAIMDERTSNICRYLDGKIFTTGEAWDDFVEVESSDDRDAVKQVNPWVVEKKDSTGATGIFVGDTQIVRVIDSGVGTQLRGRYDGLVVNEELALLGVTFPPYHGLCRSTTVPVL
jgi:SPP1 gp7 family putative phage head morphogenesis protein